MLVFPPFPVSSLCVGLLNRWLRRQAWAGRHLQSQAGKTIRLVGAGQDMVVGIQADGSVRALSPGVPLDVTLMLDVTQPADLLQALRQRDANWVSQRLRLEGDVALAQVLSDLAKNFRWYPEDELAGLFGDRVASLVSGVTRRAWQGSRQAAVNLAQNTAEYLTEEDPVLLSRPLFRDWADQVAGLQHQLAALDSALASLDTQFRRSPPC